MKLKKPKLGGECIKLWENESYIKRPIIQIN